MADERAREDRSLLGRLAPTNTSQRAHELHME
jgi:hypothetical protein